MRSASPSRRSWSPLGGTAIAYREADAAHDQADSARDQAASARKEAKAARDQADIARAEFDRDATEQARRVNVRRGSFALTVENASTSPVHDVRVFLGADPDFDGDTELAVEYQWLEELPACTSVTWRTGDSSPDDLVVVYADDAGQYWLSDLYGDQEQASDPDAKTSVPSDLRYWRKKTSPVAPCG